MYHKFNSREELYQCVCDDKSAYGINSITLNRYPIRFVLFDNFDDCFDFVDYLQSHRGIRVVSVEDWIDKNYPDLLITQIELADHIKNCIKSMNGGDCVIAPFSELARFYDNGEIKSFDSLIKTIKSIEATLEACEKSQRIYIPIVGLEGKMNCFIGDSQITLWKLESEDKAQNYKLIFVEDGECYGMKGIEDKFLFVNSVKEWLNIWRMPQYHSKRNIICNSRAIFSNAKYAQPDNAFEYIQINNAFEFLRDAFEMSLEGIEYDVRDKENWILLAQQVDVNKDQYLSGFIRRYFNVSGFEGCEFFIRIWFEHRGNFDRWLLKLYYTINRDVDSYVLNILSKIEDYSDNSLLMHLVLTMTELSQDIEKRHKCLTYALNKGVSLPESLEEELFVKLGNIAKAKGYDVALQYFTLISKKEKILLINWLRREYISIARLKFVYSDLYYYLQDMDFWGDDKKDWAIDYINKYKFAKVNNIYSDEIKSLVEKYNESSVTFDTWYQCFESVRSLMSVRKDIDVFYWIDGLGIEWIPYIKQIISEYKGKNVYLNETLIAKALLPTKTENNKLDLQKLCDNKLEKVGDLDALAHKNTNKYPDFIVEELSVVKNIINEILSKYSDKKIAIISDHGLTHLSQLVDGLNLSGVKSDHSGRVAIAANHVVRDNNYFILDDNKTLCALKHNSLCAKVPIGQGAHGGCTPEEVLVPIFIISDNPNNTNYNIRLLTHEIEGSNPVVKIQITGLTSLDKLSLKYDDNIYKMRHLDDDVYESEKMRVKEDCNKITLYVNGVPYEYNISINVGIKTDDLFDF